MSEYEVEHVLSLGNELGEGPLWSVDEQRLYWVDSFGDCIHRWKPGDANCDTFPVGQHIGSIGFREKGGFITALKNGIHFFDPETKELEFLVDPEKDVPHGRFNDGAVDRKGRYWTGTMDNNGASKLYRYDPDGSLHVMETGITCSNGIGWSPDQKTMYYNDSQKFVTYAYDFDLESGQIENRREFVRKVGCDPDGLTVDSDGCIWIAIWDGWCVERYDPDGKLMAKIDMPVQYPTCPMFGGENLDELYVTSAWTLLGEDGRGGQPQAGDLFRIQTDAKGIPEPKFAG